MFGSSLVIGDDILDIGTHKFELRHDQRAIGSGAMIPRLALGEPGQFDVPNVADVSTSETRNASPRCQHLPSPPHPHPIGVCFISTRDPFRFFFFDVASRVWIATFR